MLKKAYHIMRANLMSLVRFLMAIVFLGSTARILDSFSLDESGMATLIAQSFPAMIRSYTVDYPMLSFYECLEWLILHLSGEPGAPSAVLLRAPSVAFAALALWMLGRTGRRAGLDGFSATIPPLYLCCLPEFQDYLSQARPYALLIFLQSSALFWCVDQIRSPSCEGWRKFVIFSAMACLTKIFSVLVFLTMIVAMAPTISRYRLWRSRVPGIIAVVAVIVIQLPLIIHFSAQSAFHSRPVPDDPWVMSGHVYRLFFDSSLWIVLVVCVAASWLINLVGQNPNRGDDITIPGALSWMVPALVLFPSLVHASALGLTGASVMNTRYLTGSLIGVALASGIAALFVKTTSLRRALVVGIAILGIASAVDPAKKEGWERAAQLVKNIRHQQSSSVLYAAGFNENHHIEQLGKRLVRGPAFVYGIGDLIVPVSHDTTPEMKDYLENWIRTSGIEKDQRPVILVGLAPFTKLPEYLAERLARSANFVEMNNVLVYYLY